MFKSIPDIEEPTPAFKVVEDYSRQYKSGLISWWEFVAATMDLLEADETADHFQKLRKQA